LFIALAYHGPPPAAMTSEVKFHCPPLALFYLKGHRRLRSCATMFAANVKPRARKETTA